MRIVYILLFVIFKLLAESNDEVIWGSNENMILVTNKTHWNFFLSIKDIPISKLPHFTHPLYSCTFGSLCSSYYMEYDCLNRETSEDERYRCYYFIDAHEKDSNVKIYCIHVPIVEEGYCHDHSIQTMEKLKEALSTMPPTFLPVTEELAKKYDTGNIFNFNYIKIYSNAATQVKDNKDCKDGKDDKGWIDFVDNKISLVFVALYCTCSSLTIGYLLVKNKLLHAQINLQNSPALSQNVINSGYQPTPHKPNNEINLV